jgi:hypothetical protein
MQSHPAAAAFPLMPDAELAALAEDIKANGLAQPIVVFRGQVLDGRNRLAACERVGVAPRFIEWDGDGSPTAWVVSANLRRRHLTESQRAMVGAALVPLFADEAKERQRAAGGIHSEAVRANLPEAGRAREKAAAAVSVSPRLVESAVKVTREATPEVVEAVKRGEVAVSAAAKQAAPKKKHKEKDWPVSLVLTVPHSMLAEIQRSLRGLGFKDAGSRRMKVARRNAA